jgi:hypothetical protein
MSVTEDRMEKVRKQFAEESIKFKRARRKAQKGRETEKRAEKQERKRRGRRGGGGEEEGRRRWDQMEERTALTTPPGGHPRVHSPIPQ